ncbi:hypothetical protein [Tsukamurella soli]|uniref:Uncharacterized protein n=1 Tax=Tsukamurella soli TaxID=644556 RepID=A0ABP8JBW0_9ACTN
MGLFGQRGRERDEVPDEHLELLTRNDADRLRSLVRTTLAERGYEVEVFGDHVQSADGRLFGLDNLMRMARAEQDRRAWPAMVARHLDAVLSGFGAARPTDDELRAQLVTRLLDVTDSAQPFGYALEWQTGIAEVLTVDYPERVAILPDPAVERLAPLGPWLDLARANLRRTIAAADVTVQRLGREGEGFPVAVSDCVYLASAATFLPEVLPLWQPGIDLRGGVLFCVPSRQQLAFQACTDATAVLCALALMPRFSVGGYADGVGPLSPHVYYWRDGTVQQITRITGNSIEVHLGPELEALLSAARSAGGGRG